MKIQRGFTLIELMIALTLGLVIVAAATMLFLTGHKSMAWQQGSSDIQDDANFGMYQIVKAIRHTNLNTSHAVIDSTTKNGGIVFNVNNLNATLPAGTVIPVTQGQAFPADASKANVFDNTGAVKNDQLVIQYLPQYDSQGFAGYDCEGKEISSTSKNQMVIERYFVRKDTNFASNEPNEPFALACDAGRYTINGNAITDYGDAGQILMKRVDLFRVLLQVRNNDKYEYLPIEKYTALTTKPRILAMQLGVLSRSVQPINDSLLDGQKFQVLDKTVTVKTPATGATKHLRQVISQTVGLRNAFGERGQ